MVLGLIGAFLLAILVDLRGLLRTNNRKKTIISYFTLLTVGFILSFLQVIDKIPPSPVYFIEKIVRSLVY